MSSASNNQNFNRITHPSVITDSIELTDRSESYNNLDVTLDNVGNQPSQSHEDNIIEPYIRVNNDENGHLRLPTCSKNIGMMEELHDSKQDIDQEFFKMKKLLNINAESEVTVLKTAILNNEIPKPGTLVCPKVVKKAGPYILGPLIGSSPVQSIIQCLARKEGTNKYYTIKILTLKDSMEYETQDDRQGKMLLHSEYSLLSLLQNQDGVVHHYGFFKDCALEEKITNSGSVYTGRTRQRLCLVLDCLICHDFNPNSDELINLQHYVIREKKLLEKESLLIFIDTVRIVASLHKRNIVHRDLKLGNLVLNRRTRKVTITNFCLGKHLSCENDLLKDQRGSPAYISPDVLCGKPYLGKPSDMWALGVVLYTMLYGQFPFYDSSPTQLFSKIKAASYYVPNDGRVSEGTVSIITKLLVLQPSKRLTAVQVLDSLSTIIATFKVPIPIEEDEEEQVVPDIINSINEENCDKKIEKKADIMSHIKILTDFSKQVTIQEQMHQMMKQQPSPLVTQPRLYNQIPVYKVDTDARELTATELDKFKHLIPKDNQRQLPYNPNNRNDGILLRVRGSLRNRNNGGNQINVPTRDYSTNYQSLSTGSSSSGSSSSISSSSSNNNNILNDGLFSVQTHSPINSNLQITSRSTSNSISNLQLGNEAYLLDMTRNSTRLSRNSFNNIPTTFEYNRTMNSGNVLNRNIPWLANNFNQCINTGPAQENQSAPPTNISELYPNNHNQSHDQQGNSIFEFILRFNNMQANISQNALGSLSSTLNNRNSFDSINSSNDLSSSANQFQNQQNRLRNAIIDWLPPSFRRQQNRIDNMERTLLSRRLSLNNNRYTPYFANFRHMGIYANMLNQTNVRRTSSDSNLGRLIDSVTSTQINEPAVPTTITEQNFPNSSRQINVEDPIQQAAQFNPNDQQEFNRLAYDMSSSSNEVLADLNTLRRNLALQLLSTVIVSPQEPNNNNGDVV
ncbi:PREDICTED: probable serine/threonine-protein kinase DDB_G0277165 [Ceratosolen solmsi marchali]|uniref:Serine/threonine-protein kinase 40 n=1 Tax=Ceratosolen solmsi marchali TaxID=326594 RepID=A0AAJ6YS62_9HYME|nr:PREDICTED: probable serine/threonine-protein kinase DDB_G0277165 [Ceratosolen solmsi marchali]